MTTPTNFNRRSTLRVSLILPFVMLIALLTGTLGVLWYWTGSKTVSTLSQQLMSEMAQRISQAIDRHMHEAGAVLEAAFPQDQPVATDIGAQLTAIRSRLWTATSLYGKMGVYVHYGNLAGQGIGLLRQDSELGELRLKTRAGDFRNYYSIAGMRDAPVLRQQESKLFDPRTRPWFTLARDHEGHIWTPVYIDFNAEDLVITRSRRVLSGKGEFEGVVATDVFLRGLQDFVAALPLSRGGRAFILEADGKLIAASDLANISHDADGTPQRVQAKGSSDALLAEIHRALASSFDHLHGDDVTSMLLQPGGQAVEVAYRHVSDNAGLNWLVAVAVPHNDMLAGIRSHVVLVIALGLLALGLALALGLQVFGSVARDMSVLTHAVRRVGEGEIHAPIELKRKDEIGELAHNFRHMRHSLFTDALTGCANRNALQHILARLTRRNTEQVPPNLPFALLFIDLNHFKPLNDRWGHDNGDLALIETTQRIRSQLRSTDILARFGGDEFIVILQGIELDQHAQLIRRQLEAVLAQPLNTLQGIAPGIEVKVSASIGYALYPRDGEDGTSLLKHADQQMYRRKYPTQYLQA